MIQVKLAADSYELTDKKATVSLKDSVISLPSNKITTPGEYEAEGVEIVYGERAALLVWERVQIVYVFSAETPQGFDLSQFSSADVLVVSPTITELSKEQFTAILDAFDPTVVIFSKTNGLDPAFTTVLKAQDVPNVKLSSQTLPAEGREVYQLAWEQLGL